MSGVDAIVAIDGIDEPLAYRIINEVMGADHDARASRGANRRRLHGAARTQDDRESES